jgi:hypothetical protein
MSTSSLLPAAVRTAAVTSYPSKGCVSLHSSEVPQRMLSMLQAVPSTLLE